MVVRSISAGLPSPSPTPPRAEPVSNATDRPEWLINEVAERIRHWSEREGELAKAISALRTASDLVPQPVVLDYPRVYEAVVQDSLTTNTEPHDLVSNSTDRIMLAVNFFTELTRMAAAPIAVPSAAISESRAEEEHGVVQAPPPNRFRVRVAAVGQPHRTTKRHYNYFEELNAALAARTASERHDPSDGEPDPSPQV